MNNRIIKISPVDAEAHVYRTPPSGIIRVFDQCESGLVPVQHRRHNDGVGFTLESAPTGQVWAEVSDVVVLGLGALGALAGLDLSKSDFQVVYSREAHQGEAVLPDEASMADLVREVRALRDEVRAMKIRDCGGFR